MYYIMDRCYKSVKENICRPVPITGGATSRKGQACLGLVLSLAAFSGSEFAVAVSDWLQEEAGPVGPFHEGVRKALHWCVCLQIAEEHLSGRRQDTVTGPILW